MLFGHEFLLFSDIYSISSDGPLEGTIDEYSGCGLHFLEARFLDE